MCGVYCTSGEWSTLDCSASSIAGLYSSRAVDHMHLRGSEKLRECTEVGGRQRGESSWRIKQRFSSRCRAKTEEGKTEVAYSVMIGCCPARADSGLGWLNE